MLVIGFPGNTVAAAQLAPAALYAMAVLLFATARNPDPSLVTLHQLPVGSVRTVHVRPSGLELATLAPAIDTATKFVPFDANKGVFPVARPGVTMTFSSYS